MSIIQVVQCSPSIVSRCCPYRRGKEGRLPRNWQHFLNQTISEAMRMIVALISCISCINGVARPPYYVEITYSTETVLIAPNNDSCFVKYQNEGTFQVLIITLRSLCPFIRWMGGTFRAACSLKRLQQVKI